MRKIIIAFDCDGTLVTTDSAETKKIVANERIRTLLIVLASFKNTKIVVWSGGGEMWARQVGAAIGIDKYVDAYADKNHLCKDENGKHVFAPGFAPDIAIDDIQDCELGLLNLIVREK
jgi:phosphoserine phosphatase